MDAQAALIQQNFRTVSDNIRQAAVAAGRSADSVRLVVVTKAQPVEVVRAVIDAGARILGENYPEESLAKIQAVGNQQQVAWHMIGHLQSRKAGLVAEHFHVLQSLDSLRLAERLERLLAEKNRVLPVLLELNVSGEESKYGWPAWDAAQMAALQADLAAVMALTHLDVRGLMTMPPLYEDAERARPFFARLREVSEGLGAAYGREHFTELSMGTSADYTAAIQEGATLVRVGTAIVGPRPKKG